MKYFTVFAVLSLFACSSKHGQINKLFSNVTRESGINFSNDLRFTERLNPYTYRNFYNGGGIAIGDINNDGLADLYFSGNQVENRLYLNEGNFKFTDITDKAGVACKDVWSTGVTFVDINGDGFLDIYVCKSGDPDTPHRNNELFINNGDLTFTERSKEFGLDIKGLSVQAAFFDYDKDGDLDCYLLTNSIRSVGNYDLVKDLRTIPDSLGGGNKFLLNDNGKFIDYSDEVGIYRSTIGFGLGITLGDFNSDEWTDVYISNDFFERDYLYINDQKGSFKESLVDYFESISMGSMGADYADLDNDGINELFVTEMLPDSLSRKKTKTVYETWDKYQLSLQNGYYHQFSRNVLQKKISDSRYAEVSRLAGVSASEWSWGALLFDMDNDGLKDIFVANGIYKDLLDRDYLTYTGTPENIQEMIKNKENVITRLVDLMPSSHFPNYAFHNNGNLNFSNVASEWGLGDAMFSSGSAYGDFDNDGDLDLVVNNINGPSYIYRNNTDTTKNKSLTISFESHYKNSHAVGTSVVGYTGRELKVGDNFISRGFQSAVEPSVHLGLGNNDHIDSLFVRWPEGGDTMLYDIRANQILKITRGDVITKTRTLLPKTIPRFTVTPFKLFKHEGSHLIDFNRDRLLPMMYSNETPAVAVGDIDSDGFDEVYVGGGKDQSSLFLKYTRNKFNTIYSNAISKYKLSEETKSILFDADGDGDLDLYAAYGGRFFPKSSSALIDKIFINNGAGAFEESKSPLPFKEFISTSVVVPFDFDRDGDQDLFIAERFNPFTYGLGGRGFIFENDGKGVFSDVTDLRGSVLTAIGMITDAKTTDIDNDGWLDLVLVGDWMPVTVLRNNNKNFEEYTSDVGLSKTKGWWHALAIDDLNKDGKPDFVIGNHGLNSFFKIGDRMYVNDFDRNGSFEQIFCTPDQGKFYPILDKDDLLSQLPSLKKSLIYYNDYGKKSIEELFDKAVLAASKVYEIDVLASILVLSGPEGYVVKELPLEAQFAPIYALLISDIDKDGIDDLLVGGNQYQVKPQFGRFDASEGWFLKGEFSGRQYTFQQPISLGIEGQIRSIKTLDIDQNRYIIVGKHDDELEIVKVDY